MPLHAIGLGPQKFRRPSAVAQSDIAGIVSSPPLTERLVRNRITLVLVTLVALLAAACTSEELPPPPPPPPPSTTPVPDLADEGERAAMKALNEIGLQGNVEERILTDVKQPTVLDQGIEPGTEVEEGTIVTLVLTKPPPFVPGVEYSKLKAAKKRLKARGYEVDLETRETIDYLDGTVIRRSPRASVGSCRARS